jgi:CRISPR-associated endonuclease/helicase Cas3
MPRRPEVAPFLHGLADDPPDTFVAWRHEVGTLNDAGVDEAALSEWFRACRIHAGGRLRERTDRVKDAFDDLLKNHRKDGDEDLPVVLIDERGRAQRSQLSQIVERNFDLAYRTVLLPVDAGGLDASGMLDPNPAAPPTDSRST